MNPTNHNSHANPGPKPTRRKKKWRKQALAPIQSWEEYQLVREIRGLVQQQMDLLSLQTVLLMWRMEHKEPFQPVTIPRCLHYQHPDKPDLTWSGQGWPPCWLLEWVLEHRSWHGLVASTHSTDENKT